MSQPTTDVTRLLRRVRNIREFTPEPISEDTLVDILEVGRWTGSASNRQPTEVVVVRDPQARQKLVEAGSNTAGKAAVSLVIVTPGDPARAELEIFDDGRLAERLLVAAAAHGLGSGITTLKGEGPAAVKQMLGIPSERRVRTVVNIGHRDEAAIRAKPKNPQPRKPMTEFAHWDHY
ncbi:MAG TPA: nitroreductase family protein [Chloroflexota bacterium]|jgi:nitroreductase|nr:nitroreductase family protein [Chloroflexota bacterium]